MVAADRPGHPEPEQRVAEQVHGDAAAERGRFARRQVVRRVGDELPAADGEPDDAGDDQVVDVGVGVPREHGALDGPGAAEPPLGRRRDDAEVRPPEQHREQEGERDRRDTQPCGCAPAPEPIETIDSPSVMITNRANRSAKCAGRTGISATPATKGLLTSTSNAIARYGSRQSSGTHGSASRAAGASTNVGAIASTFRRTSGASRVP